MRRARLFLLAPAILSAQGADLDQGRLDPAWFGPGAVFQSAKDLGFAWVKPGLDLRGRTVRLKPWEQAAWRTERRASKDELLVARVEPRLVPDLARGLARGFKGRLPVSRTDGDLILVGRVVDAVGEAEDYMALRGSSLSLDLKLVDSGTGELLAAFHETFQGAGADGLALQALPWFERLGRRLAQAAEPPAEPAAAAEPPRPAVPAPPAFDLEGALRRIEGLRQDGLISEEEALLLRNKAAARAGKP